MLNNEVPAKNIRLLLNEAASDDARVVARRKQLRTLIQTKGVAILSPSQHATEEVLSSTNLSSFDAEHGAVLWLYWSGHGAMNHVTRERMGLMSNASRDDYFSINFEETANRLRLDPRLRKFGQQVIIVDACSTWAKPASKFPYLHQELGQFKEQGTRQERIFASANGQATEIAVGQLTSDFTRQLLACLTDTSPADADLVQIKDLLSDKMRLSDKQFVVQIEDADGNASKIASGQLDGRIAELADIVRKSGAFPFDTLFRLFKTVTTCAVGERPQSSSEIVWQLDKYPASEGGLSNTERFALLLEHRCERLLKDEAMTSNQQLRALAESLQRWNAKTDQPLFRAMMSRVNAQEREPGRVFIDMGEDETRGWIRQEGVWQVIARNEDAHDSMASRVRAMMAVVKDYIGLNYCHVELAIDIDALGATPLGENVSGGARAKRLGKEIPTTLRMRDRWVQGEIRANWLAGWEACRTMVEETHELVWLDQVAAASGAAMTDAKKCLSFHQLDPDHLLALQSHLEEGALWALACLPGVHETARAGLDACASSAALRDWIVVARKMAAISVNDAAHIMLVADLPLELPDGVLEPLQLPQ